jgi:hypothetical protein
MAAEQGEGEGVQITIRLPPEAIEEIENGLIPFGHYGKKRATICAALILDMLKEVRGHIREGRDKAAERKAAESR